MPASRAIHVLEQVSAGLAEAHAVGLIHRDVKPANIILCARGTTFDVAKVVDFGLVKSVEASDDDGSTSDPGRMVGTPGYMAPEILRAQSTADIRTDLYALGAVGYFLVTGTPVFPGPSIAAILADHLRTPPERPSARLGAPVPRELEDILLACLAKTPADRPRDALALRDRLRACADANLWTDSDARAFWTRASAEPVPADVAAWCAKTIAVDLVARTTLDADPPAP
jgi:eukaryotic-like serine/threonine-protein kinase